MNTRAKRYIFKGNVFLKQQKHADARELYRKAIAYAYYTQEKIRAYFQKAYSYKEQEMWQSAKEDFLLVVSLSSNKELTAAAYYEAGVCAYELKNFMNAEKYFYEAQKLSKEKAIQVGVDFFLEEIQKKELES